MIRKGLVESQDLLYHPMRLPPLYQWRPSGEMEIPSSPSKNKETLPQVSMETEWENWTSPYLARMRQCPILLQLEWCQRKPAKTEGLSTIQIL